MTQKTSRHTLGVDLEHPICIYMFPIDSKPAWFSWHLQLGRGNFAKPFWSFCLSHLPFSLTQITAMAMASEKSRCFRSCQTPRPEGGRRTHATALVKSVRIPQRWGISWHLIRESCSPAIAQWHSMTYELAKVESSHMFSQQICGVTGVATNSFSAPSLRWIRLN